MSRLAEIDRQPALDANGIECDVSSRKRGDVPCSIDVGMKGKTTVQAFEQSSLPVATLDVATLRAALRGVVRRLEHDALACEPCFVFDEALEFSWTPDSEDFCFCAAEVQSDVCGQGAQECIWCGLCEETQESQGVEQELLCLDCWLGEQGNYHQVYSGTNNGGLARSENY